MKSIDREALRHRFAEDGFALIEAVFDAAEIEAFRLAVEPLIAGADRHGRGGVRNLLKRSPEVRAAAEASPLRDLAAAALGADAWPVKGTLFDKTPDANWKVPWHQDLAIAVRERREVDGYTAWSIKDGVPHVQPPARILERMVALRLHLDDTPESNGALRVVPRSHRHGRLSDERAGAIRAATDERSCPVAAGGVMLMSPLLLHASAAATTPGHRRVVHVEYAGGELDGLDWAE